MHGAEVALVRLALGSHLSTIPAYLAAMLYCSYLAYTLGQSVVGGVMTVGGLGVSVWRLFLARRHPEGVEPSALALRRTRQEAEIHAFVTGVLLMVGTVFLFPLLSGIELGIYLGIMGGTIAIAIFSLSPLGRSFEIFLGLQSIMVWVCLYLGRDYYSLAFLTVLFGIIVYRAATLYRDTASLAFRSQIEAQQAREAAELAHRTNTQFFVAASHDLRQPLHAMGLFADSLRQRPLDLETARLVKGISSSVDALDELFSALLDINRLDSGVVQVQPQDIVLDDIFRKLRLTYEPMAINRGLVLRLRGGRHAVCADPVLLERILRNLVSNAVRYTREGGVLVSARARHHQVLIQVWDSGVGISAPEREKVFEAFYQVPQPKPDRRKGFGLGLAIVQRFARLMNAPLGLRSEVNRGTVLSLTVPQGRVVVPAPRATALRLAAQTVWLIDALSPERDQVARWLQDWGVEVLVMDAAAATAFLAEPEAPPHLLILAEAHATLIDLVRTRCQCMVPTILLGAPGIAPVPSAPDADQGIHRLSRPVAPHKLRALTRFKLGA